MSAFANLMVHRKLSYNTVIQLWPLAEVPPLFVQDLGVQPAERGEQRLGLLDACGVGL